MIDKELLSKIDDLARKDQFYTTSDMDSAPIRALREADLIDVYDMYSDGRVRWMLTAEGIALLKA